MTQRDWQKDMTMCERYLRDEGWSRPHLIAEQPHMTMYWLQEAKERGEREQRLKEEIEKVVKDILPWGDAETAIEKAINHFKYLSSTPLYSDTPAPKEKGAPINVDQGHLRHSNNYFIVNCSR